MGWWSADIMGGDTPLDAVHELEKAVRWDYEKRGGFIYDINMAEQANKTITAKSNWTRVLSLVRRMGKNERDLEDGSLLAVVYVLVIVHVKLPDEIAKLARYAIGLDEWGREGDQERLKALEDFRVKLDAATTGKLPEKRKFSVLLEREVRFEGTFEVEAISEIEAETLARQLAETASVLPPDSRFKYPRPTNVLFENWNRWRVQRTTKIPVGGNE